MSREFLLKHLSTEAKMLEFGGKLARAFKGGAVVFLYGNLGAGKTTLVRGILQGLGHTGAVKSPTYTIVEPYQFENFVVYHFDFYRVKDVHELEYIGIQDYFSKDAICLIEWPDHGADLLPPVDLSCYIEPHIIGRNVKFVAHTQMGQDILKRLINEKT